jgi:HEAT repeat protein
VPSQRDLADLRSTDFATRLRAVVSLRSVPGVEATEALIGALHNDDTGVIDAAAAALVHREDPRAIDALVAALHLQDEDAEIADHVAWVLRERESSSWYAAGVLQRAGDA